MTPWIQCVLQVGFAVLWWWSYATINSHNSKPARAIYWSPKPADLFPSLIQPTSALIYTFGASVLLVWPIILCGDWSRLRVLLLSVLVGTMVGFTCFLLWPLAIARPAFGGKKLGESIMRLVFHVDNPANCFYVSKWLL